MQVMHPAPEVPVVVDGGWWWQPVRVRQGRERGRERALFVCGRGRERGLGKLCVCACAQEWPGNVSAPDKSCRLADATGHKLLQRLGRLLRLIGAKNAMRR